MIVDTQSVKNTVTAGLKGHDAGKTVSGIKRRIAVDTLGLPHAAAVSTAEVTDRKRALQALRRSKDTPGQVTGTLVDGGYTGRPFGRGVREIVREIVGEEVTVQVARSLSDLKLIDRLRRWEWVDCETLIHRFTTVAFMRLPWLDVRPSADDHYRPGGGRQWRFIDKA